MKRCRNWGLNRFHLHPYWLHDWVSFASPMQSIPPSGGGLLQSLFLVCEPPPHVLLHVDHDVHNPHWPSTLWFSFKKIERVIEQNLRISIFLKCSKFKLFIQIYQTEIRNLLLPFISIFIMQTEKVETLHFIILLPLQPIFWVSSPWQNLPLPQGTGLLHFLVLMEHSPVCIQLQLFHPPSRSTINKFIGKGLQKNK